MSLFRRIPVPISALALGLAGLGNLLAPYSPLVRAACGLLAAAAVLLLVVRAAVDGRALLAELRTPAALSVLPAAFMALMLLATYLKPLAPAVAPLLWAAALAAQLLVVAVFLVRHGLRFEAGAVLPSWFLVAVGFVVASVTSPAFGMQSLGRVLLWAGIGGYVLVLPLVVRRVANGPALPPAALPTLAIFAAPPSLCVVGALAVGLKHPAVVYPLLAAAAVSVLFVLSRLPRILGAGFAPSLAALTFPTVISAIAFKQSAVFLAATGALVLPKPVTLVTDAAAALVVLYVLARYAAFLAVPPRPVEEAAAVATP